MNPLHRFPSVNLLLPEGFDLKKLGPEKKKKNRGRLFMLLQVALAEEKMPHAESGRGRKGEKKREKWRREEKVRVEKGRRNKGAISIPTCLEKVWRE